MVDLQREGGVCVRVQGVPFGEASIRRGYC
jgi:hypothetical protein